MDKKDKQKKQQNQEEQENNPFKKNIQVEEASIKEEEPADNVSVTQKEKVIEHLEKEKEELAKELESTKNQYIRLAADFDNYRKRQDQEKQDLAKYGAVDTVKTLLPVIDNFDRAYSTFQELNDVDKLRESFNVLYRQMNEALNKMEVYKIKTAGELFDPSYHEAVQQEETEDYPDNGIMMELQSGYMLEDRVIRPAMVKVASNPNPQSEKNQAGE